VVVNPALGFDRGELRFSQATFGQIKIIVLGRLILGTFLCYSDDVRRIVPGSNPPEKSPKGKFLTALVSLRRQGEQETTMSTPLERAACARQFLTQILTSRERMLVAACALGYSQTEIARAWTVSTPAVNKMSKRIRLKAERYWA
jgi:DNA-binding CsgD family transcriptional regulator